MTLKHIFIFLGILSGCSWALAAVKDVSVNTETASAVIQETTGGLTTYTIFGGYAGTGGSCGNDSAPTSSAVCNSCTDLSPCDPAGTAFQCAQRSIHPTLQLAITMTVDTVPATPRILIHWGTDTSETINAAGTVPIPVANQPFTVFINWSDLCGKTPVGTTCAAVGEGSGDLNVGVQDGTTGTFASGASQKFRVVVRAVNPATNENLSPDSDPDTTMGFSNFKVLPGDSKVYISEVHRGNVGPESETKWQAMRVYYGEATPDPYATPTSPPAGANFCDDIDYTSSKFVDLPVESKTTVDTRLTEGQVKGLENEKTYLFNIASVDEATIVSGFLKTSDLNSGDQSPYVARPGEVVGLLANKECFIATAAFGSPVEGHVETLRKFRNQFLVKNSLGRKFIKFYYKYSPPLADFISQNEIAKSVIRWALWPLILFAEASLAIGFLNTVLGFAVLMLGLTLIVLKRRRTA